MSIIWAELFEGSFVKKIQIRSDSWHYRLWEKWDDSKKPKTLCQYAWVVLLTGFSFTLIARPIVFVAMCLSVITHLLFGKFPVAYCGNPVDRVDYQGSGCEDLPGKADPFGTFLWEKFEWTQIPLDEAHMFHYKDFSFRIFGFRMCSAIGIGITAVVALVLSYTKIALIVSAAGIVLALLVYGIIKAVPKMKNSEAVSLAGAFLKAKKEGVCPLVEVVDSAEAPSQF